MIEEERRKIYCESSLQQLRAATVKKKRGGREVGGR